jgi:Lon protease-like protein
VGSDIGKAPLFPLPLGALLPGELLPLHVFEPRYRLMMEAVRKGDRLLAVGTLLSGWESCVEGPPRVAPVVGVGRLVRDRLNADGTSDILLRGLVRGEIAEELQSQPYRVVALRLRPDEELHPALAWRVRRHLLEGLARCLPAGRLEADVTATFPPGQLVDRIASALELSPARRAALLAALGPEQRVELLLDGLAARPQREQLAALVPSLGDFSLHLREPHR